MPFRRKMKSNLEVDDSYMNKDDMHRDKMTRCLKVEVTNQKSKETKTNHEDFARAVMTALRLSARGYGRVWRKAKAKN